MTIYLLVQETQNDHGFVDTEVISAFTERRLAEAAKVGLEDSQVEDGEIVEGRNDTDADWVLSYAVREVSLYRAPQTSVESQTYIDTGELPEAQLVDTNVLTNLVERLRILGVSFAWPEIDAIRSLLP